MPSSRLSLILLSTNGCNAACAYCFEDKSEHRLDLPALRTIVAKVLAFMEDRGQQSLLIHWQGGEAMLLPPSWYASAQDLIAELAAAAGKEVFHGLQTNLLCYGPKWNPIIASMFGNCIGSSLDFPNLYRKLPGGTPEHYATLWRRRFEQARSAGIDVKVISVPNRASLAMGAERFYRHLVDELGVRDFQVNTPFPGGAANRTSGRMRLDLEDLIRFHLDLADIWIQDGRPRGVRIGPFDALLDYFSHRETSLPCILTRNCAEEFVAVDARGQVGQCDCWVTSYPDQVFGNIFGDGSLADLLAESEARRAFLARPGRLMGGDCARCDYLGLCHGGCPIRTQTLCGTIDEKDPYCGLYRQLFQAMEGHAARIARARPAAQIAHAEPSGSAAVAGVDPIGNVGRG